MNPPAVPRPPGWAVSRAACRFTGWCVRSCATRRCTSITAAGPTSIGSHGLARAAGDGAVVPGDGGAAPGGGRRRGGCATPATASRTPLPPRSRPGS